MRIMRYGIALFVIYLLILTSGMARGSTIEYEITEYDINVRVPETYDSFEIEASLQIENSMPDSEHTLEIMLCRNFRGAKATNLHIYDETSKPLDFSFEDDLVSISLSDASMGSSVVVLQYDLVKDEDFHDQFSPFAFEISDTLCHVNASITRTDNWYPKIAETMAKRLAPYQLVVDVPEKFEVMASGELIDVAAVGGQKVYTWRNYQGITDRSLYFFAQEQERIVREYDDDFRVIMYVPDGTIPTNMDYLADVIHTSFRFFEEMYGEAPWNEYKVMAFPYGYSGLFNSMNAPVTLFTSEITNNEIYFPIRSVIHEVSHTWWGNIVSSNPDENYWLYEGFGKFSEIIGIKPALGVDVESLSFFRLKLCTLPYIDYVPSILESQDSEDRVLVNVAAYYMGATYLRMLRFVIGDKNFYKGILEYVRQCRGMCISTDDFLTIMQKRCNKKYHGMLSDYIKNPGYARYEIDRLGTIYNGKHYLHNYEIINIGDKDIYTPYLVQSDMESYKEYLFLKKGEKFLVRVKSGFREPADHIVVDPEELFPVCGAGLKGPGAIVYENPSREVKVYNVAADAPFARAGIVDDMTLIKLNGEELAGNDLRTLNHMMLQPGGTELQLLVRAGDGEPHEVTVVY